LILHKLFFGGSYLNNFCFLGVVIIILQKVYKKEVGLDGT